MTNTQLTYRAAPNAAFAGSAAELSVIVSNEGNTDLTFGTSDSIILTFPQTMVKNFNFNGTAPSGSGFSVAKSDTTQGAFILSLPFSSIIIKAGERLTFTFSQVPISDTAEITAIGIQEGIGGKKEVEKMDFEVKAKGLDVIVWLDKMIVADAESTYLNWVSSGGSSLQVSGFPSGEGTRPGDINGKVLVYVPERGNTGQWDYTVTVYSGSQSKRDQITLQQNPPIIHAFEVKANGKPLPQGQGVEVTDEVTLSWNTQYASSVLLTTPVIPNQRYPVPANPVTVTPGKNLLAAYRFNWAQLPSTARFILTANGFLTPATQEITIPLLPAKLTYFKQDGATSNTTIFQSMPTGWAGSRFQSKSSDLATFTIHQPGGEAEVYYLGSDDTVHPQIYRFYETAAGAAFNISWNTRNCKTLTLAPGNEIITGAEIAKGSKKGLPAGTYTLTATNDKGDTVRSVLEVGGS